MDSGWSALLVEQFITIHGRVKATKELLKQ